MAAVVLGHSPVTSRLQHGNLFAPRRHRQRQRDDHCGPAPTKPPARTATRVSHQAWGCVRAHRVGLDAPEQVAQRLAFGGGQTVEELLLDLLLHWP